MAETIRLKFGHAAVRVGHFATLYCLWSVFFRTWNCWPFSASVPPGWLSSEKTPVIGFLWLIARSPWGRRSDCPTATLAPARCGNYVGGTASATVGVCVGAEGSRPALRLWRAISPLV